MTDSSAIVTDLESIVQYISDLNTHAASSATMSTTCIPLLHPYNQAMPFDIFSRDGSTAYANICAPLSKPCYRKIETFPFFIVNIHIRSNKVKWSSVAPHVIISDATGGNTNWDILTEYQSISSTNIEDTFTAHTDNLAIQNSKAFYTILSKSITGKFRNTISEQAQNLPTDKYGVALLKIFSSFTVVASLQI